jgi:hypothetical protein
MNDVFLFQKVDGSIVECHAECYMYACASFSKEAEEPTLLASGEAEVAEYWAAN